MKKVPCECTELTGLTRHDCPDCGGEGIRTAPAGYVVLLEGGRFDDDEVEALRDFVETHAIRPGTTSFRGRTIRIEELRLPRAKRADEVWILPVDLDHPSFRAAIPDRAERCPHGGFVGDCARCDVEGDLAFDADREDRFR